MPLDSDADGKQYFAAGTVTTEDSVGTGSIIFNGDDRGRGFGLAVAVTVVAVTVVAANTAPASATIFPAAENGFALGRGISTGGGKIGDNLSSSAN